MNISAAPRCVFLRKAATPSRKRRPQSLQGWYWFCGKLGKWGEAYVIGRFDVKPDLRACPNHRPDRLPPYGLPMACGLLDQFPRPPAVLDSVFENLNGAVLIRLHGADAGRCWQTGTIGPRTAAGTTARSALYWMFCGLAAGLRLPAVDSLASVNRHWAEDVLLHSSFVGCR